MPKFPFRLEIGEKKEEEREYPTEKGGGGGIRRKSPRLAVVLYISKLNVFGLSDENRGRKKKGKKRGRKHKRTRREKKRAGNAS